MTIVSHSPPAEVEEQQGSRLSVEQRRALSLLKAQVRELEKPAKAARRERQRTARKARSKAIGKAPKEQRQERQRDNAYLAFTRRQPCILAPMDPSGCAGPVEASHVRFADAKVGRHAGLGRKPDDRWVLPACVAHHRAQHAAGNERKWWSGWGIDPNAECIRRYGDYLQNITQNSGKR